MATLAVASDGESLAMMPVLAVLALSLLGHVDSCFSRTRRSTSRACTSGAATEARRRREGGSGVRRGRGGEGIYQAGDRFSTFLPQAEDQQYHPSLRWWLSGVAAAAGLRRRGSGVAVARPTEARRRREGGSSVRRGRGAAAAEARRWREGGGRCGRGGAATEARRRREGGSGVRRGRGAAAAEARRRREGSGGRRGRGGAATQALRRREGSGGRREGHSCRVRAWSCASLLAACVW